MFNMSEVSFLGVINRVREAARTQPGYRQFAGIRLDADECDTLVKKFDQLKEERDGFLAEIHELKASRPREKPIHPIVAAGSW